MISTNLGFPDFMNVDKMSLIWIWFDQTEVCLHECKKKKVWFENEHFFFISVMLEFPLTSHWWAALGI